MAPNVNILDFADRTCHHIQTLVKTSMRYNRRDAMPVTCEELSGGAEINRAARDENIFMAFVNKIGGLFKKKPASRDLESSSRSSFSVPNLLVSRADEVETIRQAICLASELACTGCEDQFFLDLADSSIFFKRDGERLQFEDEIKGNGSHCKVFRAWDCKKRRRVACKLFQIEDIKKNHRISECLARELTALLKVSDHPNVVRLEGFMVTKGMLGFVLELIEGRELLHYITKNGPLNDALARSILFQTFKAVADLHDRGIVHRDLKLENIMITTNAKTGRVLVKIIDFGFSNSNASENSCLSTFCGTENYAAPELLLHKSYDGHMVDAWALGVVFYVCLQGFLPFATRYNQDKSAYVSTAENIVAGRYRMMNQSVSAGALKIINGMLTVDPAKRLSVHTALESQYFIFGQSI